MSGSHGLSNPSNNWIKYSPLLFLYSATIPTTWNTILDITGNGYISKACITTGNNFISSIKVTIDDEVILIASSTALQGGGLCKRDLIKFNTQSSLYFVPLYTNIGVKTYSVLTKSAPTIPLLDNSQTICSLSKEIFFKKSLKVEVMSTSATGASTINVIGGIQ